ncbi:MAG: hypothetical protein P8Y80_10020 [Acidobacteriota bacterium]|jgi:hypothetical protein
MLTKLGRRGYTVREGLKGNKNDKVDYDSNTDPDRDRKAPALS